MNREEIRARINALECLSDVQQARGEVACVDWEPGDRRTVNVNITSTDYKGITFVNRLPQTVVIAGLLAMEGELIALANLQEVAA